MADLFPVSAVCVALVTLRLALAVLALSALLGYGLAALLTVVYPALPLAHVCPWYVFLFGMGMAATDMATRPARFPWLRPSLFALAVACLAGMLHQWPITAAGEGRSQYLPHLPLIDAAAGAVTASCPSAAP